MRFCRISVAILMYLSIIGTGLFALVGIVLMIARNLLFWQYLLILLVCIMETATLAGLNICLEYVEEHSTDTNDKKPTKQVMPNIKPEATTEDIDYCKKCGYQLFPEDSECPICKTKRVK